MEINKRENIGWIDLLRVTACFLVVFAHCCDPFVARSYFSARVRIGKCRTLLRALVCDDDRSAAVSCTKRHE